MPSPLIAVVDDESIFVEMVSEILTDEGYRVITSVNASNALPIIRQQRPELIILDIRMEKPDAGWTVLSTLRLAPETLHTPVIICSADGRFLSDKSTHLHVHGVEALEKPFNIEELVEMIRRMLKPEDQTP